MMESVSRVYSVAFEPFNFGPLPGSCRHKKKNSEVSGTS